MDNDICKFFDRAAKAANMTDREFVRLRVALRKWATSALREGAAARPRKSMTHPTPSRFLAASATLFPFTPKDERYLFRRILAELPRRRSSPRFSLIHVLDWHLPYRLVATMACVILLMTTGVTVSFAAESALPGDVLYPVKIYVNESVQSLRQSTPTAKAAWAVERVERRLREAVALRVQRRRTPSRERMLLQYLRQHRKEAQAQIIAIAPEHTSAETLRLQSTLEATFTAYRDALTTAAASTDDGSLLRELELAAEEAGAAREEAVDALTELPAEELATEFIEHEQEALTAAEDVREAWTTARQHVPGDVSSAVSERLEQTEEVMEEIQEHKEAGDFAEALLSAEEVHRLAQETETLLMIQEQLQEQSEEAPSAPEEPPVPSPPAEETTGESTHPEQQEPTEPMTEEEPLSEEGGTATDTTPEPPEHDERGAVFSAASSAQE
ncbi:MAG: hypothetical protein G01um101425_467 [Candidatus Peregrinibacteria bacterium Gr01-1014_25]|nr:MAG: hypothetical protein G01um101425_467 [Candidatus Peregrinibacteria bacterium Gr01-1014_25]